MASLRKYIGDRTFYRMVAGVVLPIVVQNGISTFVNLLDNLMVGSLGTEAMSGVSVVNQFMFIYNLIIFGAVSAAGIFMAQYHGSGDVEGERYTFRLKMIVCLLAGVVTAVVFWVFRTNLISLFLQGGAEKGDPALTLQLGKEYLGVMLIGLLPFAVSNAYSSSMRETGDTVTPMLASIVSVATNFSLNWVLIFGHLGAPALGVRGAAIATVTARFAEMLILVVYTHSHRKKFPYITGVYRTLYLPMQLIRQIAARGLPLMFNELFWSLAVTTINQSYSTRGLEVVAAQSIYSTLWNVFSIVYLAMGNAIAIVIGNLLGAGKLEEARDTDRKMIVASVFSGLVMGLVMAAVSGVFPLLYNTGDDVRHLATCMMLVASLLMPFHAFINAAYFSVRSGGQVLFTVLMDSLFMWLVPVPVCMILSQFTSFNIYILFAAGQLSELLKAVPSIYFLRRGNWVRRLVGKEDGSTQNGRSDA